MASSSIVEFQQIWQITDNNSIFQRIITKTLLSIERVPYIKNKMSFSSNL
jgi:hypothetical protein